MSSSIDAAEDAIASLGLSLGVNMYTTGGVSPTPALAAGMDALELEAGASVACASSAASESSVGGGGAALTDSPALDRAPSANVLRAFAAAAAARIASDATVAQQVQEQLEERHRLEISALKSQVAALQSQSAVAGLVLLHVIDLFLNLAMTFSIAASSIDVDSAACHRPACLEARSERDRAQRLHSDMEARVVSLQQQVFDCHSLT